MNTTVTESYNGSTNNNDQTAVDTSNFYPQSHLSPSEFSPFEIFRIIFLSACLFTSMAGNGCVLWASGRQLMRRKYTRLHALLVSLALSDMLQGPCQIAPQLVEAILKSWDIGEAICKIHALTRSMFANISISTLAIITIERFLNVESVDGNAKLLTWAAAIAIVWISQAALAVPMAVWTQVVRLGSAYQCRIPFSKLDDTLDYTVAVRVVAFFCPLGILWICNLGVIYKLRKSDRKVIPFSTGVTSKALRKRRSRRVTLTCLMLATAFTVNLTPFQTALLVVQMGTFSQRKDALESMPYVWLFTVFNCCLNPFIYGFLIQDCKKWILRIFACKKMKGSQDGSECQATLPQNGQCSTVATSSTLTVPATRH